jgi:photosystem II stability/assembly factor-like uncharacterized protein
MGMDYDRIVKTTDGGFSWTVVSNQYYWEAVDMITADVATTAGFVVEDHGTGLKDWGVVYRTTNGGASWTRQAEHEDRWYNDVDFVDVNTGTVVGYNGVIVRTTDGGANWMDQVSGVTDHLYGVSFADANAGVAVGEETILYTTDGGATWNLVAMSGQTLRSVDMLSPTDAIAVGDNGTILRTGDIATSARTPVRRSGPVLRQNTPNPFNPTTSIEYVLPAAGAVTLTIYDVAGRRVATLVSEWQDAGAHDVIWNGRDNRGAEAPSGVYFYRLSTADGAVARKMVLLK